jgi:hypothetical protein
LQDGGCLDCDNKTAFVEWLTCVDPSQAESVQAAGLRLRDQNSRLNQPLRAGAVSGV